LQVVAGLNQRQTATFLKIKPSRLEWAGKGGIIKRDKEGFYPCETVTAQWLDYERALHAGGKKKRSQFERHCSARKGGEQGFHLPGPPIGWPNLSL
jgi:hypothetical protein